VKTNPYYVPGEFAKGEYLKKFEKCHEICGKIYIARHILHDEKSLMEQLTEIDKLLKEPSPFYEE
jgi:hypothetical protein